VLSGTSVGFWIIVVGVIAILVVVLVLLVARRRPEDPPADGAQPPRPPAGGRDRGSAPAVPLPPWEPPLGAPSSPPPAGSSAPVPPVPQPAYVPPPAAPALPIPYPTPAQPPAPAPAPMSPPSPPASAPPPPPPPVVGGPPPVLGRVPEPRADQAAEPAEIEADVETEVGLGSAWDDLEAERSPAAQPPAERLSFTAAYPPEIPSEAWQTLVVVLHVPDAQAQVASLLARRAPELGPDPAQSSTSASVPVRRGSTITLVPMVAGVEFNPPRLDVTWHEDVQDSMFRMRTSASAGTPLFGAIEVQLEGMPIAMVPVALRVVPLGSSTAPPQVTQRAGVLDRIFVSYSRRDTTVVEACANFYRALGVQILMDAHDLRGGQDWRESLHNMISQADLFQLYWSDNSAGSSEVEHEWRYAKGLTTKGTSFIRPLYWESPMPEPPGELSSIHFSKVDLGLLAPAS
jgi:hypothetical protein